MILDASFPPDLRVEKEALTLVASGHNVVLFCLSYDKDFYEEQYKGITIAHYRSGKFEYKLSALAYTVPFYHWMMKSKIADFIQRYQPQVIHVHDMVVAGAVLPLVRDLGLKSVLDLHENRPEIMKEYRHIRKFPGRYLINLKVWSIWQNRLASMADSVVVVTNQAKQILAADTGKSQDSIFVVPNTPTLEFANHPLDDNLVKRMEGTFNMLYVGDTSERRGTADMIRVVAMLKDQIPEIRLWVVGKSSFDRHLRTLVEELNVSGFVHFEGWQPERLFPSYIHGAHICLSPLKRNLHHDTTFANKVFQYMALGRPVLVSDCPAQAELIDKENAGLVFAAGDTNDFADKVRIFYSDPDFAKRTGENGRHAVERKWNWEQTSRNLVDMYAQLNVSLSGRK